MKNNIKFLIKTVLLYFVAVLCNSCGRDKAHPGYTYYPDMTYSRAYETFSSNAVSENGFKIMGPVEGTVSREMIPYLYNKSKDERIRAGVEYFNPFTANDSIIAEGRLFFGQVCLQCHGEKADGKGNLFVDGFYKYPPANLLKPAIMEVPDGEIFHVITVGYNLMGPHGSMLRPEDRWKVVHYLRLLQQTATQKDIIQHIQ